MKVPIHTLNSNIQVADLGLIHTIGPVTLRSGSGLGPLSVLGYSHVRSALAPLSLPSFPLPRHQHKSYHQLRRMCDFSDTELAIIAVALDEEEERKQNRKRKRLWVHPMLQDGKTEGEFHTLYPHLVDDENKFHSYFRMNKGTFEKILSKIKDDMKKENTPFREALTPREKLAVCSKVR